MAVAVGTSRVRPAQERNNAAAVAAADMKRILVYSNLIAEEKQCLKPGFSFGDEEDRRGLGWWWCVPLLASGEPLAKGPTPRNGTFGLRRWLEGWVILWAWESDFHDR